MSSTITVWLPRLAIWAALLLVGERVSAARGHSPYVVLVLLAILLPVGIFSSLLLPRRR